MKITGCIEFEYDVNVEEIANIVIANKRYQCTFEDLDTYADRNSDKPWLEDALNENWEEIFYEVNEVIQKCYNIEKKIALLKAMDDYILDVIGDEDVFGDWWQYGIADANIKDDDFYAEFVEDIDRIINLFNAIINE